MKIVSMVATRLNRKTRNCLNFISYFIRLMPTILVSVVIFSFISFSESSSEFEWWASKIEHEIDLTIAVDSSDAESMYRGHGFSEHTRTRIHQHQNWSRSSTKSKWSDLTTCPLYCWIHVWSNSTIGFSCNRQRQNEKDEKQRKTITLIRFQFSSSSTTSRIISHCFFLMDYWILL